jgi:hypothetical protein
MVWVGELGRIAYVYTYARTEWVDWLGRNIYVL